MHLNTLALSLALLFGHQRRGPNELAFSFMLLPNAQTRLGVLALRPWW